MFLPCPWLLMKRAIQNPKEEGETIFQRWHIYITLPFDGLYLGKIITPEYANLEINFYLGHWSSRRKCCSKNLTTSTKKRKLHAATATLLLDINKKFVIMEVKI